MEGWDKVPLDGGNWQLGIQEQFPWLSLSHASRALPRTCLLLNSQGIFKGLLSQP